MFNFPKKTTAIFILFLFLAAVFFIVKKISTGGYVNYKIFGNEYKLLLAKSNDEIAKGLSGTRELKNADGMIFLFSGKEQRNFWNKNTYLDLVVYWISGDKIVGIDYLPSMAKSKKTVEIQSPPFVDKVVEVVVKKEDKIFVFNPLPDDRIASPLAIKGIARGTWFFEASFPVRLRDENGKEISVAVAQAHGEWMTEDFIPFSAELFFSGISSGKGTFVFEKDNPSGLPQYADEIRVPVNF